jgi:hypothetical protein
MHYKHVDPETPLNNYLRVSSKPRSFSLEALLLADGVQWRQELLFAESAAAEPSGASVDTDDGDGGTDIPHASARTAARRCWGQT